MTRRMILLAALCFCASGIAAPPVKTVPVKPKLVVGIVFDQFRYDYLTRFREDYNGGFDRLLRRGAVFTNARLIHYPTVTAVGHATFLTGATPSVGGIIGNEWYERETGKKVTSVSDDTVRLLGGAEGKSGASPGRLLVSTVGDELKLAGKGKSRVIGISIKDRAAILPSGHMADGAYWFDNQTGNFVSSTFYFPDMPGWVRDFNGSRAADKYLNSEWRPLIPQAGEPATTVYKKLAATPGPAFYGSLEVSPYGNEVIERFAERAVEAEQLGQRGVTDLLTISFSCNDYVGHPFGPHSREVRDMSIRSDRLLGKFLQFLDSKLGMDNVVVILTADHGVAPLPEYLKERKMPGGRLDSKLLSQTVESALSKTFGEEKWILGTAGSTLYFDRELIRRKNLDQERVEAVAARAAFDLPHIYGVYTRTQLLNGSVRVGLVEQRVLNGFNARRSADLIVIEEPYWVTAAKGATHGSPFGYDSHLPVVFMGPGIRPGVYHQNIAVNDIAPTLASLLEIETPAGSTGRALHEILANQRSSPADQGSRRPVAE